MSDNNIAIIGVSFEFPNVNNLIALWEGFLNGNRFYNLEDNCTSTNISAWGSVANFQHFDYNFFGYSYKEACYMDPQHRLLLHHSWHALEDAGYMNLQNMPITGVYASTSINDYLNKNLNGLLDPDSEDEILLGNINDFIATRIAYNLNLKGPALNIQCGCSSGLACIHEARVALLTRQCDLGLVGAVSLSAPHDKGYIFSPEGIRSCNGEVRPFDHRATGTVFTNGVAVLILKRLQDAIQSKDHIYGVIAGSALNNDGSNKASFTAPAVTPQADAIYKAMRLAHAKPQDFVLIEAHGTGTSLGDPIEFEGLCRVFEGNNELKNNCALQSSKANLGHLNNVCGLAGIIKAILVLKHQILPPQINFEKINPKMDLANSSFYINDQKKKINAEGKFIGVTALGLGGTNVHVVLSYYLNNENNEKNTGIEVPVLLSTKSENSFNLLYQKYKQTFNHFDNLQSSDCFFTSVVGRTHFQYRKAVWFNEQAFVKEKIFPEIVRNPLTPIAFLFPGQGSQYINMGAELYKKSIVFKEHLDNSLNILKNLSGRSFDNIIFPKNEQQIESLYQTKNVQPLLFAFEVAFARYLIDIGIYPKVLLGHSLGEYSTLVISNVLEEKECAWLVLKRAELMAKMKPGKMLAVMANKDVLAKILPSTLDIAAYNAPELTIISGVSDDIKLFSSQCQSKGIYTQSLQTSNAFHSRVVEPILEEYKKILSSVQFKKPKIDIISNVDGSLLTYDRLSESDYWLEHIRYPVNFISCIKYIKEKYCPVFFEVGPGKTLKTLTEKIIGNKYSIINTLPHPKELITENIIFQQALCAIWEKGYQIDWLKAFDDFKCGKRISLPSYPFEQTKCWIEPSNTKVDKNKLNIKKYRRYWRQLLENNSDRNLSNYFWILLTNDLESKNDIAEALQQRGAKYKIITVDQLYDSEEKIVHFIERLQNEFLPIIMINSLINIPSEYSWEQKLQSGPLLLLQFLILCEKYDKNNKIREFITLIKDSSSFLSNSDPDYAIMHSMIKAANQEIFQIRTRLIDLSIPFSINSLMKELEHETRNVPVLIRNEEFFVEDFEEYEMEKLKVNENQNGSIVIFGGMGFVGMQYTKALLNVTEQPIVLVQKSSIRTLENPKSDRELKKTQMLKEIRKIAKKDRLQVISADITDLKQLKEVCHQLLALGPIDTIIHAAGIDSSMHYKLMKETDKNFINACFFAKRDGLLNIAIIAKDFNVRHCHIISSISSILAGIGMYTYSGMHAYIDSFVELMNKIHTSKWTSINWEAWDVGSNEFEPEIFRKGAFGEHLDALAIKPQDGIALIENFWPHISKSFIISSIDLNTRYSEWVEGRISSLDIVETLVKVDRPELFVDYSPPVTLEEQKLCKYWSDILAIEKIGMDDNFFELGGHSLMALKMIQIINKEFKKSISIIDLFEFPTIRKLCQKICDVQVNKISLEKIIERSNLKQKRLKQVAQSKQ